MANDKPDVMIERPDGSVDELTFDTAAEAEAEFNRLKAAAATDLSIVSLSWFDNAELP